MNLSNQRIVITRPRTEVEGFADALRSAGAQPILFPVIQINPPDDFSAFDFALRTLEQFDWLILTSVHGVDAFFERLNALGLKRIPPGLRVAAVGSKTAKKIFDYGARVDYVPDEFVSEALSAGFGKRLHGLRFLFPQSNLARTILANGIRAAGGLVTEVVAYCTVPTEPDRVELEELRTGVDIVTFTSPSTVQNFIAVVRKNGLDPLKLPGSPLFACIGPATGIAALDAGLTNILTADEYTTAGLIRSLRELVTSQNE
jgi:uroporphyrinogen III methyltransferase / synthase